MPTRTRQTLRVAIALATIALAACAPDAIQGGRASGFDGYLDTLKRSCPNMQIGGSDIGQGLTYGAIDDNYNYWLDMTSRLYYGRIGAGEYQAAVTAQLGPGTVNAAAYDCILRNLPAQRG